MKLKEIFIDYENICLNCKEKGFYFGFSFKTISYKGKPILDIPARYLNGPAMYFEYNDKKLLLYSVMNSHQAGALPTEPVFAMMNSKYGDSLTKFTYQYLMQNNKAIKLPDSELKVPQPKIVFYVDTYHLPSKPYILMYYGMRNLTGVPLNNYKFYQFYDFDIYGQESHNGDCTAYNKDLNVIYQYNKAEGPEKSLIAGITSTAEFPPTAFEGNKSMDILVSTERENLRNTLIGGPDDCAIAFQWDRNTIEPNHVGYVPVALVMGFGIESFLKNVQAAKEQLETTIKQYKRSIDEPTRQEMDPKLQKMSFSVTEWCKDGH